jgi:hypothetical protein
MSHRWRFYASDGTFMGPHARYSASAGAKDIVRVSGLQGAVCPVFELSTVRAGLHEVAIGLGEHDAAGLARDRRGAGQALLRPRACLERHASPSGLADAADFAAFSSAPDTMLVRHTKQDSGLRGVPMSRFQVGATGANRRLGTSTASAGSFASDPRVRTPDRIRGSSRVAEVLPRCWLVSHAVELGGPAGQKAMTPRRFRPSRMSW